MASIVESSVVANAAADKLITSGTKFMPRLGEFLDAVADLREAHWAEAKAQGYEPSPNLTRPALPDVTRARLDGEVLPPGPAIPEPLRELLDSIGRPKTTKRKTVTNDAYWERVYGAVAVKRAEESR